MRGGTVVARLTTARPLRAAGALIVLLALALAGCGEYSPVDDGSADPTPSSSASPSPTAEADGGDTGGGGGNGGGEPVTSFTFGLPPSDTSVSGNNGPGYGALLRGCGAARAYLSQINLQDQPFFGFTNPRYVAFYSAGLAIACNGDYGLARAWTEGAIAYYGLAGTDRPGEPKKPDGSGEPVDPPRPAGYGEPECDLYRTLVSALRQVHPDSLSCHAGSTPTFRSNTYETADGPFVMWDDPCTFDVDESTIVPANAAEATPAFCVPIATPPRPVGSGGDEPPEDPSSPSPAPSESGLDGGPDGLTDGGSEGGGG